MDLSAFVSLRSRAPVAPALPGVRSAAPRPRPTASGGSAVAAALAVAVARTTKTRRRFLGNLFGPEEVVDPEDPGRVGVCKEYQSMPGRWVNTLFGVEPVEVALRWVPVG